MDLGYIQAVWHVYPLLDRAKHGCPYDPGKALKDHHYNILFSILQLTKVGIN